MEIAAIGEQLVGQAGVGGGEDLHRQQAGIDPIADRHGGHRDPGGHLHDRMERIHAREGPALHRHANHRQGGERGDHAGQVGGATGAGDHHLEAPAGSLLGKGHHLQGRAVGRKHPHLNANAKPLQQRHGRLHGGQVRIAAHHHRH